ncbi:winged helix-turn-helix domain-containing protein [Xanthovirga aplysinae]|uniref:winged helix-turn-helix domain-containing protein n=1 Tax=Xanthovirga aplysinae TaxID=2529853 RepID=UPI0012BC10D8|nr:crosslink repair DNA glycosylase YcaQ family protein [Xanthovirga aplysinae]MTI32942.1 winged helix-turn-helix domain-containing protein [Xanthovirga aplysinae]
MSKDSIIKQLQRATLQCQGLSKTHPFGSGKKAVLRALEHLGYVQIDTLSVIERANHHTFWTRIPGYQSEHLNQLIEERKVFEYWFHAASYLPMRDFRYALPQMLHFKRGESRYFNNVDSKSIHYVYERIRIDGPQKARDFKSSNEKSGKWWNWKPTKVALEKLFMQGDLMICGRDGMEKIYDLTERVLPNTINTVEPSPLEFAEHLVETHLRAYGFTTVKQITHLKTGKALRKNVEQALQTMLEKQKVQQIKVEGMPTIFALNTLLESTIKKLTSNVRLLSPFDNSIIHRDRIKELFNFDFRLECYTPKEKRRYGYFCLPILYGDEFIGRVDCKAHRKKGQLELIHLHIENRQEDIEIWLAPLIKTIKRFATFNGCQSIKLTKVSPLELTSTLKQVFAK